MFLNIIIKDALNLNTFLIKYTKYSDNSIDKEYKIIFKIIFFSFKIVQMMY